MSWIPARASLLPKSAPYTLSRPWIRCCGCSVQLFVTDAIPRRARQSGCNCTRRNELMSTEQNKNVILRWRQGLNERNLNVIDDLLPLSHITGVPGPVRGPEAFKQLFTAYPAAFDISVTPEFL